MPRKRNPKAIALARDVLHQLRCKAIVAESGIYVDSRFESCHEIGNGDEMPEINASEINAPDPGDHCRVCAVGSMVVAMALREPSHVLVIPENTTYHDSLKEYLSADEALQMEASFESWGDCDVSFSSFRDDTDRLAAIMVALIDNGGRWDKSVVVPSRTKVMRVLAGEIVKYNLPIKRRKPRVRKPKVAIKLPLPPADYGHRILSNGNPALAEKQKALDTLAGRKARARHVASASGCLTTAGLA